MTAAYKETDVTIRIRSNRYYSAEYRIAVHPTIRPRSEYEANIRYSPTIKLQFTKCFASNVLICFSIYTVHDEVKDKAFELELSWVGKGMRVLHFISTMYYCTIVLAISVR